MKYLVTVGSNFNEVKFESNSRNSIQHLRNNGGHTCIITTKGGKVVSKAQYSDECGYYHAI